MFFVYRFVLGRTQAVVRVPDTTSHTKRPLFIKADSKHSIICKSHAFPFYTRNGKLLTDRHGLWGTRAAKVAELLACHPLGFREWMPTAESIETPLPQNVSF